MEQKNFEQNQFSAFQVKMEQKRKTLYGRNQEQENIKIGSLIQLPDMSTLSYSENQRLNPIQTLDLCLFTMNTKDPKQKEDLYPFLVWTRRLASYTWLSDILSLVIDIMITNNQKDTAKVKEKIQQIKDYLSKEEETLTPKVLVYRKNV